MKFLSLKMAGVWRPVTMQSSPHYDTTFTHSHRINEYMRR